MITVDTLHKILDENSTYRYTIEFKVFHSNHLPYGIIALRNLGASEERIVRFVKWYETRLELPTSEEKAEAVDEDIMSSLLGKEVSFYAILKYFNDLLENKYGSIDKLIAAEFPKLSAGCMGAAFHGAMHLGHGYSVNHKGTVLEGLAYLHFAYSPLVSKGQESWHQQLGEGECDVIDVFTSICKDTALHNAMLEGEKQDPRLTKHTENYFQIRADYLMTEKGDNLIDYARSIKLPDTVYENGIINPAKLCKQILEWAVTVYTLSEVPNNFFILHGVTSTWSLLQIVPLLSHDNAIKMLAELLVGIEATYLTENSPKLCGKVDTNLEVTNEAWSMLIEQTLAEDRDEHIYKLVQICHEQSKECQHVKPIFLQAAMSCVNNKLV